MSEQATLTVNGRDMVFAPDALPVNVAALLQSLAMNPAMAVAEVNGEIVRRGDFATRLLRNGDTVEIVRLVGGG